MVCGTQRWHRGRRVHVVGDCYQGSRGRLADIRTGEQAAFAGMLDANGFDLVPLDAGTVEQAAHLPPLRAERLDHAPVALA